MHELWCAIAGELDMITHRHTFRVIYGDTDMAGVVYYGNYLRYFEAGRAELLRAAGVHYRQMQADGATLPVAEAHVRYRAPATYDDELTLTTQVEEVRAASLRISYRLERAADGALIATGETVHACVGSDGRPQRLPAFLRDRLQKTPDGGSGEA